MRASVLSREVPKAAILPSLMPISYRLPGQVVSGKRGTVREESPHICSRGHNASNDDEVEGHADHRIKSNCNTGTSGSSMKRSEGSIAVKREGQGAIRATEAESRREPTPISNFHSRALEQPVMQAQSLLDLIQGNRSPQPVSAAGSAAIDALFKDLDSLNKPPPPPSAQSAQLLSLLANAQSPPLPTPSPQSHAQNQQLLKSLETLFGTSQPAAMYVVY
jgi:hypothetical protein